MRYELCLLIQYKYLLKLIRKIEEDSVSLLETNETSALGFLFFFYDGVPMQ